MKKIICIGIALLMVACAGEKKVPEGMIPENEMVNILLDIHLMESQIEARRYLSRDSMQVAYMKEQASLFKKHKIDSAQYYKSYDYYFTEMSHMKDIYTKVAERMKVLSDSVAKIPASKRDSLIKSKQIPKDRNKKKAKAKPKLLGPKTINLKPIKKPRIDKKKKK